MARVDLIRGESDYYENVRVPFMERIFIVTPYFQEPIEWLRTCHESVLKQAVPCRHVLIADGNPQPEIDDWDVHHIKLPVNAGDAGNTPRAIGGLFAQGQKADALAYLDADNWYTEDHISEMVEAVRSSGADIATAAWHVIAYRTGPLECLRTIFRNEGSHPPLFVLIVRFDGRDMP
jgi:glycosyltransferase involved in cell wall biosynthesis